MTEIKFIIDLDKGEEKVLLNNPKDILNFMIALEDRITKISMNRKTLFAEKKTQKPTLLFSGYHKQVSKEKKIREMN